MIRTLLTAALILAAPLLSGCDSAQAREDARKAEIKRRLDSGARWVEGLPLPVSIPDPPPRREKVDDNSSLKPAKMPLSLMQPRPRYVQDLRRAEEKWISWTGISVDEQGFAWVDGDCRMEDEMDLFNAVKITRRREGIEAEIFDSEKRRWSESHIPLSLIRDGRYEPVIKIEVSQ